MKGRYVVRQYRRPTSEERDMERVWCSGDCAEHPNYRHPDDLGDLFRAVAALHMVWDSDGDLVLGIRTMASPDRDVVYENVMVGYTYLNSYDWEDDYPDGTWESFCETVLDARRAFRPWADVPPPMSVSTQWMRWLIEDIDEEDKVLDEVRQRLGLEGER